MQTLKSALEASLGPLMTPNGSIISLECFGPAYKAVYAQIGRLARRKLPKRAKGQELDPPIPTED